MVVTVMEITSQNTIFLGNVKAPKLVTEFPTFYANWRLITMWKRACHSSLSVGILNQFMSP